MLNETALYVTISNIFLFFQVQTCTLTWPRNSVGYLVIFFSDLTLFYGIPLLLSLILYSLIAKMLLFKSKSKFPGGGTRSSALSAAAAAKSNQQKFQVGQNSYYYLNCSKKCNEQGRWSFKNLRGTAIKTSSRLSVWSKSHFIESVNIWGALST